MFVLCTKSGTKCQAKTNRGTATSVEGRGSTGDCRMIHMPIDYIDDHVLLTVETGTP
jgi:hypothetical protein